MDCRVMLILCTAVILAMLVVCTEGRTKKVVIHVPYKVKKIKHTHTVYKTVHHHHSTHDPHMDHNVSPSEDHEHFHHLHIHEDTPTTHVQPAAGLNIPEFLPDVPIDVPINIPDVPHEMPGLPTRHKIPLYRRT